MATPIITYVSVTSPPGKQFPVTYNVSGATSIGAVTYDWEVDATAFGADPANVTYNTGTTGSTFSFTIDHPEPLVSGHRASFTLLLTVAGSTGPSSTAFQSISSPQPSNAVVVIEVSPPISFPYYTVELGSTMTFDLTNSYSPEGSDLSFFWRLQSSSDMSPITDETGTSDIFSFTPPVVGSYSLAVDATDEWDGRGMGVSSFVVISSPPPFNPSPGGNSGWSVGTTFLSSQGQDLF